MIKVNIKNQQNEVGWSATFNDQELADAWVSQGIAGNWWGKPERWVNAEQEDVSEALETREIEGQLENVTEYLLPCQYAIEQEDIGNAPQLENVRAQRNTKLAECDWTQLADSPLSPEQKLAWADYRQALRDLPNQEGFNPLSFEWPSQPE